MDYFSITPKETIVVTEIYTLHYYENYKNYFFPGERHNFWELLYVDRGECIVHTDTRAQADRVTQGDVIFHKPNEFHSFYADNIMAHNIAVLSFNSASPAMDFFARHPLHAVNRQAKKLIGQILTEAGECFEDPLNYPALSKLRRREQQPFGGEQTIQMLLALLLIGIQKGSLLANPQKEDGGEKKLEQGHVERTLLFLKDHVRDKIRLDDVCANLTVSRSQLQKIFHRQTGRTVMRYLTELRIEEAKFLIRSGDFNFTEIAQQLQYNTIHHFSKQFKELTGMSPTEYSASMRSIIEITERTYHVGDKNRWRPY